MFQSYKSSLYNFFFVRLQILCRNFLLQDRDSGGVLGADERNEVQEHLLDLSEKYSNC